MDFAKVIAAAGLLLAAQFPAAGAVAATPTPAAVSAADALFANRAPGQPGGVVLISKGGKPLYARAFGSADIEHNRPMTADTPFMLASVSKQFAAFAAALLAHEGKLDLDRPIRTYLPELAEWGNKVTARHLIHHTAGLRDQMSLFVLAGNDMQSQMRQGQALALITNQRALNFEPGTEHEYTNSGYSLIAEIVARVSGKKFSRFMKERIFTPLGMNRSFIYDDVSVLIPGRAESYVLGSDGKQRLIRVNNETYGATGQWSTAADLTKWARELLHPRLFDPALIRSLSQPTKLSNEKQLAYGFGLMALDIGGYKAIAHGGTEGGFRTMLANFPEQDLSIVLLFNGSEETNRLTADLARIFIDGRTPANATAAATPELAPAVPEEATLADLDGFYVGPQKFDLMAKDGNLYRGRHTIFPPARFRKDGSFTIGANSHEFYLPVRNQEGKIIAVEMVTIAGRNRYEKSVRPAPPPSERRELAGSYWSSELDSSYRLQESPTGELLLTNSRTPEAWPLMPTGPNRFEAGYLRIEITRGQQGKVDGMLVSTIRARNVKFVRL